MGPRECRGSHLDCPGGGHFLQGEGVPAPGPPGSMPLAGLHFDGKVWHLQLGICVGCGYGAYLAGQDIGRGLGGLARGGGAGQRRSDRVLR